MEQFKQVQIVGRLLLAGIAISLLSGCQNYQMTLNEAVVYSPPQIFTDFTTLDPNLRNCLDQAIIDQSVTQASNLRRLSCSHAGIRSLAGLEIFLGLEELQLSHNQLTQLQPLMLLGQLRILLVDNNRLKQIPEVLTLGALERLDSQGNPSLNCQDLKQLATTFTGELTLPKQCLDPS
jgi:Leucine-rich repeat (LRR) protein